MTTDRTMNDKANKTSAHQVQYQTGNMRMYSVAGGFVPLAVVVCRLDVEGIVARRQVGVGHRTGVVQFIPPIVISLQFVGEGVVLSGNVVGYDERDGKRVLRRRRT